MTTSDTFFCKYKLSLSCAVFSTILLIGCGGGGGGGGSSSPQSVTPPPTPTPIGELFDFSTIRGTGISFSNDEKIFGVQTQSQGSSFQVFEFVNFPDNFRVQEIARLPFNGSGSAPVISKDGQYAFLYGTPNTSTIDPSRYTQVNADGENRNRFSYIANIATEEISPVDVFEAGTVIVSDSFPIAINDSTGIAYHYSFNMSGDSSTPSTNYTVYGYNISEGVITQEIDVSDYDCGNRVQLGDYSPERNRVVFNCGGSSIVEILNDGSIERIDFQDSGISLIGKLTYAGDKVWAGVGFGGPVRTAGYAIDLETSEVTILSTPEFEGEIFSVSEDLRYHLFNSGSHITADDVDEDQNDYDTWVCRTGEGVLGCSLMDSDLAETQFDIARYIFKNGVRLIARTEIKDNTLFSE